MESINIKELAKEVVTGLKDNSLFKLEELEKDIKRAKLDTSKKYEKPIILLSMVEESGIKSVLTTANISTTIGAAKSKKTFFSTIVLASLLGYKEFAINGDLQGLNVILFDTEQSHYHVQKIHERIKRLKTPSIASIEIFVLRPFTPDKRLAMIEYYLKQQKGNYSFVIIDGVVDLLYDFNDLHESKKISSKLMEWSSIYNCHINTVLRTNKDKHQARGHLGTELNNKSETVFRISKEDDNSSIVECDMSRNQGFEKWVFSIKNGLPVRNSLPSGFYDNDPVSGTNSLAAITETDELPF